MKLRKRENMEAWKHGNARVSRLVSRALLALGVSAFAYCGEAAVSPAATRWRIAAPRERIEWDVANDARLPHGDKIEMSGRRASLILSYDVAADRRDWAQELLPGIRWTLEYCRRKLTADGVVASDCDELETRLPAGDANLCTSALYADALRHAALLETELGNTDAAADCTARAEAMARAIDRHFGCEMRGFRTYRYYEGCEVLRAWIGIPLCMGIYDRAEGTADALFSTALWNGEGMLSAEGDKNGVTWDRSALYAFRGVFAAGLGDKVFDEFVAYARSRLLGEHVPYAVEAWPEGDRRHLSAESALYCRIVTEGLFGIDPAGLGVFDAKPHLPKGVERMTLKNIRAFGRVFSITADADGTTVSQWRSK